MDSLLQQVDQPQVKSIGKRPGLGILRGAYRRPRPAIDQPSDPSVRHISLTQGQIAVVDAHLFEWLSEWNWYAKWDKSTRSFYAVRNTETINGKKGMLSMHRQIVGALGDRKVDHYDRDTLHNAGRNLRLASNLGNARNKGAYRTNKSGYKGVSWRKARAAWNAQIQVGGRKISLGCFSDRETAALAYDQAAIRYYGQFAVLNFPERISEHCLIQSTLPLL